jgi:hypothetical protein
MLVKGIFTYGELIVMGGGDVEIGNFYSLGNNIRCNKNCR